MKKHFGAAAESIPAVFDCEKNRVVINSQATAWKDMKMEARRQFDQGFWSTNSEHHAIIHDLGHAVHYKRDSANYDRLSGEAMPSAARSELAGKVSRYAMESPLEFVAAVFAGLFDGKVYDAAVIKWYKQFKGPPRTRQGS